MNMRKSASIASHRTDLAVAFGIALAGACAMAMVAIAVPGYAATKPAAAATAAPVVAEPAPVPTTTLDRIKSSGRIVLGYRTDAAPMSSRDASGKPVGYSVELCGKVADALKRDLALSALTVEWVVVGSGFADVAEHRADLVCSADTVTLANREQASFSIPIFPGGVSALVRSDAPEQFRRTLEERPKAYQPLWRGTPPPTLEHRTYSALVGSETIDALKSRIASMRLSANVAPVANYEAGLEAVIGGSTDVLFGERAQLLQAVQSSPDAKKLTVLERNFTFGAVALALARNDDDFRLAVDRALTSVYADPQFGAIYAASFGALDTVSVAFFRSVAVPK
jgi:polar amino acid transport system substrate-binding protein